MTFSIRHLPFLRLNEHLFPLHLGEQEWANDCSVPEPRMGTQWLFALLNVLYWTISYPLLLVIYSILIVLYWIASPLIHLGHFMVQAGLLPFHILAKLEVRSFTCPTYF